MDGGQGAEDVCGKPWSSSPRPKEEENPQRYIELAKRRREWGGLPHLHRVLPSSCTQLTRDIFISPAHTEQRRNKFICKSTLQTKDKISAGYNKADFLHYQRRNPSLLLMHFCTIVQGSSHKASHSLCPMKQKTEKQNVFPKVWTFSVLINET